MSSFFYKMYIYSKIKIKEVMIGNKGGEEVERILL